MTDAPLIAILEDEPDIRRIMSDTLEAAGFSTARRYVYSDAREGAYLGVEAELGREGIRRVVETPLTDAEKALLVEAYEAVKTKQADVTDL